MILRLFGLRMANNLGGGQCCQGRADGIYSCGKCIRLHLIEVLKIEKDNWTQHSSFLMQACFVRGGVVKRESYSHVIKIMQKHIQSIIAHIYFEIYFLQSGDF
jgi:hypothetical protein